MSTPLIIPKITLSSRAMTASAIYALGATSWNVYKLLTRRPPEVELQKTPWHPPQWKDAAQVQLIGPDGTAYIFDAVLKTDHLSTLRTTDHPIQSGANITDHSYVLPEKVAIEIGMSDVMDSYTVGQWKQYSTKSISAYQKLKELQYSRKPLTLVTRLNIYENMILEYINTPDDNKTVEGLRCSAAFRQIMTAQIRVVKVSSRPHTTGKTSGGFKQPKPITPDTSSALSKLGF